MSRTLRPPRDGVASALPVHLIMPQGEVLEVTEADGGQRCPPRVNASSTGGYDCEARTIPYTVCAGQRQLSTG